MRLRPQPGPSFQAHQQLVRKLYAVRLHVLAAAIVGLILVGSVIAWETQDPLLLSLALFGCAANVAPLLLIGKSNPKSARTTRDLDRLECGFVLAACAGAASIGAMSAGALLITDDALIHLAVVALELAAVATCLRNYFSPWLVPAQTALLVYPPAIAMAFRDHPIYWALALGSLILGYVITKIAEGLYREALTSLRKDEAFEEQYIRFKAALNNMAQGLCMYDADGRLLVCNRRYLEIYSFSDDVVRPGITLKRVLEHSQSVGNHADVPIQELFDRFATSLAVSHPAHLENDLGNGRTVALFHQPLEGGGWVTTHEDITERKAAAERIAHLARHDDLTDLPNRTFFSEMLDLWLQEQNESEQIAVFCLDLDRFKVVNDTLGHGAGDAVLKQVAARIRACGGQRSFVARFGGDEFAIVQKCLNQPAGAISLADAIMKSVTRPFEIEGRQITIGVSIGIAVAGPDLTEAHKLIRNADLALYRAKAEGRNQHRFFAAEMDDWLHNRRHLELDLRRAIPDGQLELLYQPMFHASSRSLTSFEALLRWHHPERGIISPDEFIPIAEETGLITSIGEWVLRTACTEANGWPPDICLAVNLSPVQVNSPNLVAVVASALAAAGLNPERLELEVTENVLLGYAEIALATLHTLRRMGVRIVMDDFGTGYSSLSNLRAFPFDKIKIDRSFVSDLASDRESLAIVRAVRDLGRSFGMSVTAEGVETEAQLELLQAEGCNEVQGFLLGKPMPASDLGRFMDSSEQRKSA